MPRSHTPFLLPAVTCTPERELLGALCTYSECRWPFVRKKGLIPLGLHPLLPDDKLPSLRTFLAFPATFVVVLWPANSVRGPPVLEQ